MNQEKLSIIIPVYNEERFIAKQLNRLLGCLKKIGSWEIIVVNDGSDDQTASVLKNYSHSCRIFNLPANKGKGYAVRFGISQASGTVISIIDADLEYDPLDAIDLSLLVLSHQAGAVYGNRMHRGNPVGHYRYFMGNIIVSAVATVLYGKLIKDIETGCKIFRLADVDQVKLKEDGFGIEIELTVQLLKNNVVFQQPPITYRPRRFSQGKKIKWFDGLRAVWLLVKLKIKP